MHVLQYVILLLLLSQIGCEEKPHLAQTGICDGASLAMVVDKDFPLNGALVSTRFNSYEEFKSVVQVDYSDTRRQRKTGVRLVHCSNGREVISELKPGVSENDFVAARDGGLWERLSLILKSPYAARHRRDMQCVFTLARRRPDIFGDGDPAFYDISEEVMGNISKKDSTLLDTRDLTSEKGYFNTINHITAQVFMTAIFSERLADFMADAHERKTIPEIVTGQFTEEQIADLENGPVDNFVDIINNEWGQELGKLLGEKYHISRDTYWTPKLLASFLNDIQRYYGWAFQIEFKPFKPGDEVVKRFAYKTNRVMQVQPR